jgi:acetoacetyl-CoA synthetase
MPLAKLTNDSANGIAAQKRLPIHQPSPATILASQFTSFEQHCETQTGLRFSDPASFQRFSVEEFRTFWRLFLNWSGVLCEGPQERVCVGDLCELNYVENLLRIDSELDAARPALTACHHDGPPERLTRGQLRVRVSSCARALERLGVRPGDRVVAVARNNAEVIVGALATLTLGATFSSAAPDMGAPAILSRFQQLSPSLLMVNLLTSEGKSATAAISEIVEGLPTLQNLIVLDEGTPPAELHLPVHRLADFFVEPGDPSGIEGNDTVAWRRFAFNHPLFILFSSGTTGRPKCIVHGAGGTLLEHLKEHRLHGDLGPSDKLFFHTSAAWMMWNWQLSALGCGAEIVVYDGPLTGPETLWRIVSDQEVTVFGTSPPYIKLCKDAGYSPRRLAPSLALRSVLSTGSILYDNEYRWVREHVGSIPLQSISGGTDIIGCFVLGHPNLPVYPGESQSRSLGLDVKAATSPGVLVDVGIGDLVCCNPFPSRPLGFFGDSDGIRFHAAYFRQNPGVWSHGDVIEFTQDGTARLHGRSDSVLNVNGNRIGPAEIYHILLDIPEIRECMAIEQRTPDGPESSRMVLLVVPHRSGSITCSVQQRIRKELVRQGSPAYVPALITEVEELPTTYSGKRSERAVRDALNGIVSTNSEALRNPECLERICQRVALDDAQAAEALLEAERQSGPVGQGSPSANILATVERLWRKVLRHPAGPSDRWDESGGDSLKLLRFVFELEETFGQELPLDRLRMSMTTAEFAAAIENILVSPPATGRVEDDGRPTVFLFPGQSGDSPSLASFRAELEENTRFVLIKYPSWQEMVDDKPDVEDMAELALAQIKAAAPEGDLMLAGYSLGGAVAFSAASRLIEMGRSVTFFAVLDTNIGTLADRSDRGFLPGVSKLSRVLAAGFRNLADPSVPVWDRARTFLVWRFAQGLALPACKPILRALENSELAMLPDATRFTIQMQLREALQLRAFKSWVRTARKQRIPGRMVLFRSEASRLTAPPDLGWGDIFDTIDVIDVSGDHVDMLRQPHRAGVCVRFAEALAGTPAPRTGVAGVATQHDRLNPGIGSHFANSAG